MPLCSLPNLLSLTRSGAVAPYRGLTATEVAATKTAQRYTEAGSLSLTGFGGMEVIDESLFQTLIFAIMTQKNCAFSLFTAILSCLFLGSIGCKMNDKTDISDFYYQPGFLKDGKMYIYRPVGATDNAAADYWYNKTEQTQEKTTLISRFLDKDMQMRQACSEIITPSGAVQKQLTLYEKEPKQGLLVETPVQIKSGALFPFEVLDTNTMIVYEVQYALPGRANLSVAIKRNRRYAGPGPTFTLQGKQYETIKMVIAEQISSVGEGNANISGYGVEWYARGLGRVYYKKVLGDGQVSEEYELVEIRDDLPSNGLPE